MVIGLIDAHQFAGVSNAFDLLDRTTDAAEPHLPPTALDRDGPQIARGARRPGRTRPAIMGGMSRIRCRRTVSGGAARGGERYRVMAPRYLLDETYFDPLSENRMCLPNHHAYSFCNALSSAMQAYMVGGSEKHLRAATNAFEMITCDAELCDGRVGSG
jgi:hypothetical protein